MSLATSRMKYCEVAVTRQVEIESAMPVNHIECVLELSKSYSFLRLPGIPFFVVILHPFGILRWAIALHHADLEGSILNGV